MPDGSAASVWPFGRKEPSGSPEIVNTGHTTGRNVREGIDPPVTAKLVGVIAADVGRARDRRRLVLQVQSTVRWPNVRKHAEARLDL